MQEVAHLTRLAQVWDKVKTLGFETCVSIEVPYFFQNFKGDPVVHFSKGSDGTASLTFPVLSAEDQLTGCDVDDAGGAAASKNGRCRSWAMLNAL